MRIGIDIDNTVLSYDAAFRNAANALLQLGLKHGIDKEEIKEFVVSSHGEASWTKLQGIVYSAVPRDVTVKEGFLAFIAQARVEKVEVAYVSHKTKFALSGPKKNMRNPVKSLMKAQGLISPKTPGAKIYFRQSLEEKIDTINSFHFDFFIDDLASVLAGIIPSTQALHLGCRCSNASGKNHIGAANWVDVRELIFG
jgi:hypothetical protein